MSTDLDLLRKCRDHLREPTPIDGEWASIGFAERRDALLAEIDARFALAGPWHYFDCGGWTAKTGSRLDLWAYDKTAPEHECEAFWWAVYDTEADDEPIAHGVANSFDAAKEAAEKAAGVRK